MQAGFTGMNPYLPLSTQWLSLYRVSTLYPAEEQRMRSESPTALCAKLPAPRLNPKVQTHPTKAWRCQRNPAPDPSTFPPLWPRLPSGSAVRQGISHWSGQWSRINVRPKPPTVHPCPAVITFIHHPGRGGVQTKFTGGLHRYNVCSRGHVLPPRPNYKS